MYRNFLFKPHFHLCKRSSVTHTDCCLQQVSYIIDTSPNLRDSPIHVQKGIYRYHCGSHGIFRGKYRISRNFGKVTYESKVNVSFRNNIRSVACGTRHEICAGKRHQALQSDPPVHRCDTAIPCIFPLRYSLSCSF